MESVERKCSQCPDGKMELGEQTHHSTQLTLAGIPVSAAMPSGRTLTFRCTSCNQVIQLMDGSRRWRVAGRGLIGVSMAGFGVFVIVSSDRGSDSTFGFLVLGLGAVLALPFVWVFVRDALLRQSHPSRD